MYALLLALVALFSACYLLTRLRSGGRGKNSLPPSPPGLPIIGNLHQLGEFPHISLANYSKKYGSLMLIHLGSKPTLVISSAAAAREILKTHDISFAAKPPADSLKKIFYQQKDLFHLPYGDEWRKLRSIVVQELLGGARVRSFNSVMEEEVALLVEKISGGSCSSSWPVNMTEELTALTSDLISRAAFGKKYSESELGRKFLEGMDETLALLRFTVGDFVPWLGWINRVSGYNGALDRIAKVRDEIMDAVIEDHLNSSHGNSDKENFMDILLQVYKGNAGGVSIDLESVKGLLLDVITAGTETSSSTLIWAMAELIRHPAAMIKMQKEVRERDCTTFDDLQKMHYLKAVIKETLRLHPPVPIYLHMAREYVDLNGFDMIAPNTLVMINAWAIGRDPAIWAEPEKFKPERFLNSSVDFKGVDFEFIPFGAGRRICPGIGFAATSLEHTLANLMHKFDWALPDGANGEDMDVTERPGFTVAKKTPLIVVASIADNSISLTC